MSDLQQFLPEVKNQKTKNKKELSKEKVGEFKYIKLRYKRSYTFSSLFKKFPKKSSSIDTYKDRLHKKYKNIREILDAIVFIKVTRTNSFLVLSSINQDEKSTTVKFSCSAGFLKYRGRKKRSPAVREETAQLFAKTIIANNYRLIDIYLISLIGPSYHHIIKGLISGKPLMIRYLYRRKFHGHGLIRAKKARRV